MDGSFFAVYFVSLFRVNLMTHEDAPRRKLYLRVLRSLRYLLYLKVIGIQERVERIHGLSRNLTRF